MTESQFVPPEFGQDLPAAHPSDDTLALLWNRRSTAAKLISGPGPSQEEMDRLLTIAARAPDHRRVVPYRFILFEGEARDALGDIFAAAAEASSDRDAPSPELARSLAFRAPSIVFVISSVNREHKTPEWEQILTAGAVCQNFLIAASAMGYAAQWISEWVAYDENVRQRLDMGPHERVAGILYVGTATEPPKERARPDVAAITTRWPTNG
ncbi:nitroreductase [Parvularcula marina]|uniref:nitroreductase family protein n=1 Tax=Parvularcula marina TaxID=2292771 RepID=UPI003512CBAC